VTPQRSNVTEDLSQLVQAHLDGRATHADVARLAEREDDWVAALRRLLADADAALQRVRANVSGPERDLVLADFDDERRHIADVLATLAEPEPEPDPEPEPEPVPEIPQAPQLQLSWARGRLVAWAAGAGSAPEPAEDLLDRLQAAGSATGVWTPQPPVALPGGAQAEALSAPIHSTLGWLVALGTPTGGDELGPSARWLGYAATLAVRLVAQGRMVPQLEKAPPPAEQRQGRGGRSSFAVRWTPALIDADELAELARTLPGSVAAVEHLQSPRAFTEAVVTDFLDAICRDAAARMEVPAPPPDPRTQQDLAEAFLATLDGTPFDGPDQRGGELRQALQRWAAPVTSADALRLVVQLEPPDDQQAWHLRTLAAVAGRTTRVGHALSSATDGRRAAIKRELDRLEVLHPPLLRARGRRRGEVVLSQDEAWDLMTSTGPVLVAAGFDVRVPPLSRRKLSPGLRLTSLSAQDSAVGAQQLATVRWSAVFDDVELSAADITRLAAEARPLVQAHGRWVELDHADLDAVAAALDERAAHTRLTGVEMLRHALGLDGPALAGGISVAGGGWAADLVRRAAAVPEHPPTRPPGFSGELRSYQAEALRWLEFLDETGLGGVLALDMGLGKTPTMLAHLRRTTEKGVALVIAPPAVVGNWAAEARRFVPDLRVVVHHGSDRAERSRIAAEVADADVVVTTYGTAVRDIAGLTEIAWGTLVLDEAQVIKNPASETAQQLRRLGASTRVALTGTPVENGLGDLWALLDFTNPGLVGERAPFVAHLSSGGEHRNSTERALRTLNGVLVFRRTKAEPAIAAELPDRIDVLDHCPMTPEQIGLYQAVLDDLTAPAEDGAPRRKGAVLAAITALKQICNHPAAYAEDDGGGLAGRSGKLTRCQEIVDNAFAAGERVLIFTHFAAWGEQLAAYLSERTGVAIDCYHGGLTRSRRDRMVRDFQQGEGAGALVLSLKAGGTGLNLTAANHVVLYDRWWNPAVEDQARDRSWRIGQTRTVISHRLVVPGTVDERVEEVVAGKRRIADLVLPASSSAEDLQGDQLRLALGLDPDTLLVDEPGPDLQQREVAA